MTTPVANPGPLVAVDRFGPAPVNPYELTGDAEDFTELTFPRLSKYLKEIAAESETAWFAVGIRSSERRPICLAIGKVFGQEALLYSIYVLPSMRRQGLSALALALWEREAAKRGAGLLLARFSEGAAGRRSLQPLLQRSGWAEPAAIHFQLVGHPGKMGREGGAWAGVRKRVLLSQQLEYAPFVLKEADEPAIARLLAQPQASCFPDPRKYADSLLPDLSLALRRRDGELVGWLIAVPGPDRVAAGVGLPQSKVVRFAELYVDAALWTSGAALGAFYYAFLRQAELYGEDSLAVYFTHPGVPEMVAFSRRRFAPMALRFDTVFECRKEVLAGKNLPTETQGP